MRTDFFLSFFVPLFFWGGCKCIVSMVDGDLFDKLARIGSILRKKIEPFGGIQVRSLSRILVDEISPLA